jgi:flavin reductase (DIM6/NTAB) family NADH-FMN oxidoreductase RutF
MTEVGGQGAVDQRLFRDVMGTFATGVTVVTLEVGGVPRGMTANAVLSLSLDPPLVVVCVQQTGSMHDLFVEADAFGVNILAADQRPVSDLFASHGEPEEPMGGFAYRIGPGGTPLLDGTLGFAECRIIERLPGGDHMIVIGEATNVGFGADGTMPLLFHRGRYRLLGDEA